jgi:hypothetical protein
MATAGTVRTVSWSNQDLDHTVRTSRENLIYLFLLLGAAKNYRSFYARARIS